MITAKVIVEATNEHTARALALELNGITDLNWMTDGIDTLEARP